MTSAAGPFFGPGPQPTDDPDVAAIHYMMGDGFLGPGDDAYAGPVARDDLDPPLRDGEEIAFEESRGELRVTRDC